MSMMNYILPGCFGFLMLEMKSLHY